MSFALEIAKSNVKLDFFVCIEGMGWPDSLADLSTAWAGDIFAATDYAGTLSTDLTGLSTSVSFGLKLPGGVSEEFDPRTLRFKSGSMTFEIIDHDDKLRTNITPELVGGVTGQLYEDMIFDEPSPYIDNADHTYSNDDKIWVADSELIILKNKTLSSGTVYRYINSVRGAYGTTRGRPDSAPMESVAFAWNGSNGSSGFGAKIRTWLRRWYNKKIVLFAKVPGESRDNAVQLYRGRIRDIQTTNGGIGYRIATTSEVASGKSGRIRRKPPSLAVVEDEFLTLDGTTGGTPVWSPMGTGIGPTNPTHAISDKQLETHAHWIRTEPTSETAMALYQVAYAYQYRNNVNGGTAGVVTTAKANPTSPQAYQDSNSNYIIGSMVSIEGNLLQAMFMGNDYRQIVVQAANWKTGSVTHNSFEKDARIDFLLDNITDSRNHSRWVLNNKITRNAVDVMLAFLTSMDNEFAVVLSGHVSSITNITLADGRAATRISLSTVLNSDDWVGYSLHGVIGDNGLQQREIVACTTSAIDVVPRLPSTSGGSGFHIRNSAYDILPIGWGVGIPHQEIDIASFEAVRDKYLDTAELGKFAIGDKDDIDVWDLVLNNICSIYGILLYNDRFTGKLTARYVGDRAVPDGVDETYPTITTSQIIEIGEIDYMPRSQISAIKLKVRDNSTISVRPIFSDTLNLRGYYDITGYAESQFTSIGDESESVTIHVQDDEGDVVFQSDVTESVTYEAMLHDERTSPDIVNRMVSRLNRERIPDPEVDIKVSLALLDKMQAGAIFSITEATRFKPIDPYTGTRGWSGVLAMVKSVSYAFNDSNPGIAARIVLLSSSASGRIAPAAAVSSKGNDGSGHYFVVKDYGSSDYAADNNTLDWALFAVDDRIELRDSTGAALESEVIKGFGSNLATEPANASEARVYVDGSISTTIAAGQYITFQTYSTASSTTNEKTHAVYADANETKDADAADKYA